MTTTKAMAVSTSTLRAFLQGGKNLPSSWRKGGEEDEVLMLT